jgi:hypothetical protein
MKNLLMILKLLAAAIFVIGLDIIIPFSSAGGLGFVKMHGKWLLFIIGFVNVFVGGGIAGGFLDNDLKAGFRYWFQPLSDKGKLNPTHGFAGLILVINLLIIIFGIEP